MREIKGLPVIGQIGVYRNNRTNILDVSWSVFAALCFGVVMSLYGYVGWLKFTGQA